ncbi:LLM class flavin-dependent oxidoreductase [Gordonia rubripertincta]|uniref:LLM class flavin-dependent oxidoreductase n=1 Tax=Gordonia rubripertincta TaxID=36822 RepID=A0ABT4MWP4_GORRU|nr:LLM class flavin-dependent oxidoreductase [Gordonia rubripertincta]MCZ4551427.1 LLM class flavin-dependent oxidoreductase [Gordonia rubripertincta]
MRVGVGLWGMRSTVYSPAPWQTLYRQMVSDAKHAEHAGFDGFWLAEHHFWYDGWCPQPLVAASAILAETTSLRVGTAMHLLPMHDPVEVAREVDTLHHLHGERLDFGVGLGYRDEEYDGVGIARRERGRRMSAHLDHLLASGSARVGSTYVGGVAEPAVRRAAGRGLSLLLPNTLSKNEVLHRIDLLGAETGSRGLPRGRVAMLIDTWITDGSESSNTYIERLVRHYREYAGAWYKAGASPMFARPDLLDRQSARTAEAAVVGSAAQVLERLLALRELGIDTFVLQVRSDSAPSDYRRVMDALADQVIDAVRTRP